MNESISERFRKFIKYKDLTIRAFEMSCGLSNGYIKSLKNAPSPEKIRAILEKYPELSKHWLMFGEGEMLVSEEPVLTKPHIPFEVAAGRTAGIAEAIALADCEQRPIISVFPRYDLTMTISGRSMEPQYVPGDIIALRAVDAQYLRWGEVYVVSSTEGVVIKRVYDAGDAVRLVSYNSEYPDYSLPKSTIINLYKVVGQIRIHL